jgi:hypothetical protein
MSYQWIVENQLLRRLSDGACIPWPPAESEGSKAKEWIDAGNSPAPVPPPPPPTEREICRALYQQEAEAAGTIVERLRTHTPAQIRTFVTSTATGPLTSFTAPQRTVLAEIAVALGYALRGGHDK